MDPKLTVHFVMNTVHLCSCVNIQKLEVSETPSFMEVLQKMAPKSFLLYL